jgi:hypothetical protein
MLSHARDFSATGGNFIDIDGNVGNGMKGFRMVNIC